MLRNRMLRAASNTGVAQLPIERIAFNTTETATGVTSITLTKPTGTTEGDLILIFVVNAATITNASYTGPSGWTEAADLGQRPNNAVYYKIATASEPSTYTVNAGNAARISGIIVTYRYAAFDVAGSYGSITVSTAAAITAPSITVTEPNSLLLAWFCHSGQSERSFSTPSGMDVVAIDSTGNLPGWGLFSQDITSGASSTRTSTPSGAVSFGVGILLALKNN